MLFLCDGYPILSVEGHVEVRLIFVLNQDVFLGLLEEEILAHNLILRAQAGPNVGRFRLLREPR